MACTETLHSDTAGDPTCADPNTHIEKEIKSEKKRERESERGQDLHARRENERVFQVEISQGCDRLTAARFKDLCQALGDEDKARAKECVFSKS